MITTTTEPEAPKPLHLYDRLDLLISLGVIHPLEKEMIEYALADLAINSVPENPDLVMEDGTNVITFARAVVRAADEDIGTDLELDAKEDAL
jgi:hypothetical protein